MKYLCLVYHEEAQIDALLESEYDAFIAEVHDYREALRQSGHYISSDALQPVRTATTIRIRHGKTSITDGPFAEMHEQLGSYFLIDAKDLDAAMAIAARIPDARFGAVEIRPVMDVAGLPTA